LGAAEFPALFVLSPNYKTEPGQPALAKIGELKQQKWCKTLVLTSKDGGLTSKKGGFKDKIGFNEQARNGGLTGKRGGLTILTNRMILITLGIGMLLKPFGAITG
jgi:hypothetical protein